MTCVVGLVSDGDVWLGADSASGDTGQWTARTNQSPKVFRNGSLLMGFTTSFRMGQLLRWSLTVPPHPDHIETHEWLATSFVEAVRHCLAAGGFARKDNNVESGGQFLVGYRGGLFFVDSDYHVAEPSDGYAAVGCGEPFALGSLHTTGTLDFTPEERVRAALSAAAAYSAYVRAPFHILKS